MTFTPVPTPHPKDVERFWSKVDRTDSCWLWKGSLFRAGYGAFGKFGTSWYAHRIAYELSIGPIPQGLQIDHLCHVRRCVNPRHLEAVTGSVNALRGYLFRDAMGLRTPRKLPGRRIRTDSGYCGNGHPTTPENRMTDYRGGTTCRPCSRDRVRKYREAKRRLGLAA